MTTVGAELICSVSYYYDKQYYADNDVAICIEIHESCKKKWWTLKWNDELCISNDELCIEYDAFNTKTYQVESPEDEDIDMSKYVGGGIVAVRFMRVFCRIFAGLIFSWFRPVFGADLPGRRPEKVNALGSAPRPDRRADGVIINRFCTGFAPIFDCCLTDVRLSWDWFDPLRHRSTKRLSTRRRSSWMSTAMVLWMWAVRKQWWFYQRNDHFRSEKRWIWRWMCEKWWFYA